MRTFLLITSGILLSRTLGVPLFGDEAVDGAFRPLKVVRPATLKDESSTRGEIDRFVSAKMEETSLEPNPPADKYTLLRRLCFDLTGLPPEPEEVTSFANDDSLDAYEKAVDRLLSSPSFR